jgi:hypothetical protein
VSERAAAEARAGELAAGVWRDGELQDEASCSAIAEQIEVLLARFPDSLPIAEHLATACEAAVRHEVGPQGCWSWVERIAALDRRHADSARIAGALVEGLKWTACELPSAKERLAIVDRIEAVIARFPGNVRMAEDLALTLRAIGVRARHGLLASVLVRADELRLRFPDSSDIAYMFAHLLCYAVRHGSRGDDEKSETACAWHRAVRVIEPLLYRFPGSEDLAAVLGGALSKEGRARRSVLGREACAARIAALAERFPESESLAQSHAQAIAAVGRLHRTIPGRRDCIARIQALQVRFPGVARIGHALERLTSPYEWRQVAAPLARDGFASRRSWVRGEALQRIDNLIAAHVALD